MLPTKVLSDDALLSAQHHSPEQRKSVRAADQRYRLGDLLSAMLNYAPYTSGERYVAICLHIAHQKGELKTT